MNTRRKRPFAVIQLCGLVTLLLAVGPSTAANAESFATITGSGSTWSEVAVQAWAADVAVNGLTVEYSGVGSTAGRQAYINTTADFAVSEIPFQLQPKPPEPAENPSHRPHAYLPIVAGGTSFMYHVTVGGELIRDLRLSGETITKIFTGLITNWNDPQITADYGKQLPSIAIQPVVRQDGSGTSAQFSLWMATQYPDLWNDFCGRSGLPVPCGLTSFYPQFGNSVAQTGSNGVANYVAASFGEGAINYVEYAYALNLNYPVAKVLNNAGYYTLPTASNVAVALTQAGINEDLTQELAGVYNNADKRTYPLSSYSYMIIPITTARPMNEDKGRSLSTYINYFLCEGQQKAEVLGYSPLPINLVQGGFEQVRRIPGFVEPPDDNLAACNNPTFQGGENILLRDAPFPSECDRVGVTNCDPAAPDPNQPGGGSGQPGDGSEQPGQPGAGPGQAGQPGSGPGQPGSGPAGSGPVDENGNPLPSGAAAAGVDPETGLPLLGSDTSVQAGSATGVVQEVGAFSNSPGQTRLMFGLTGLELLLAVILPPVMAMLLRRRRPLADQRI